MSTVVPKLGLNCGLRALFEIDFKKAKMSNAKFAMIRSVAGVGGMTVFSRISGLIRDIAFAQFLGSGAIADAFFVAFRIPNFFRRIFGEGALSVAFVPVYSEFESQYPENEA